MHRVDVAACLEQLGADVAHRAHAGRAIAPLVAPVACGHEEVPRSAVGSHARLVDGGREDQRRRADQAQRCQVLDRVIWNGRVQQLGNRHVAVDHQPDGVVVTGLGHCVGANVAACTHLVVHDHGLAQGLGQGLRERARRQVRRRTGRKAHNDLQRLGGPGQRCGRGSGSLAGALRQRPRGCGSQGNQQRSTAGNTAGKGGA